MDREETNMDIMPSVAFSFFVSNIQINYQFSFSLDFNKVIHNLIETHHRTIKCLEIFF
jgi:hypothetical protein